jgi:hypothetical protein
VLSFACERCGFVSTYLERALRTRLSQGL